MPRNFCLYGHLVGLTPQERHSCRDILSGFEFEEDETVLDFLHEGHFLDAEELLAQLQNALSPSARGGIDIINHQDWTMLRCDLRNGQFHCKRIALDNALDTAYASEHR